MCEPGPAEKKQNHTSVRCPCQFESIRSLYMQCLRLKSGNDTPQLEEINSVKTLCTKQQQQRRIYIQLKSIVSMIGLDMTYSLHDNAMLKAQEKVFVSTLQRPPGKVAQISWT